MPTVPSSHPMWSRRGGTVTGRRRFGEEGRPTPGGSVAVITCTSIVPEARIARLMTEPRTISDTRDRSLWPRTSWVAFSARGEADQRARDVGAGHLGVLAVQLLEQLARAARARRQRPRPAVSDDGPHVHPDDLAVDARRDASRPAEQVLVLGRAGERRRRSAPWSPRAPRSRGARDRREGPRRPGPRPRARQALAGRRDSRHERSAPRRC